MLLNAKIRRAALAALIASGAYNGITAPAHASSWSGGNGNWSSDATTGWNGTGVPNAVGAVAEHLVDVATTTTQDNVAGVTVGTIRQGGTGNFAWVITAANGLTLNQDGAGAGSALIENVNTVTTPNNVQGLSIGAGTLTLADNLVIRNASLSTRTGGAIAIASTITGTGNISVENNSTSGNIALFGPLTFDGNLTNAGTGSAGLVISGAIGAAVDNVIQSNTSNTLTLSGTNSSFVGNVSMQAGTLTLSNNAALGTGKLVLSGGNLTATSGTAINTGATMEWRGNFSFTSTNSLNFGSGAVTVGANSQFTLGGAGSLTFSGPIGGTGNLTLTRTGAGGFIYSGAISHTGNLTVEANVSSTGNTFSGLINNTGTFTYAGTGTTATVFSGGVGGNVTELIQTSTGSFFDITSAGGMTVSTSKTLTSNTTATNGRNLRVRGGVTGSGVLTLNMLSANSSNEITFDTNSINLVGTILNQGAGGGTSRISGGVGANVTGITQTSASAPLIIDTNAIQMNAGGTTLTSSALGSNTALFSITGGTAGTGNLLILNNSNMANGISFSSQTVNHDGFITNQGTGGSLASGNVIISSVIGTNVDGVIQDSATSGLTLNATNLFTTGVQVKKGTLSLQTAASAGAGGTISLGESLTSNNATAVITANVTVTNPITIATSNSGVLTLAGRGTTTAGANYSGVIALNDDIILNAQTAGRLSISGAITGSKTITVDNDTAIENTGLALTFLSGNNSAFSGGVIVKRGHASAQTNANAFGTAAVTLGDTIGSADARLSVATIAVANDINVVAGGSGTRTIGNFSSGGTTAAFSGLITLGSGGLGRDVILFGSGNSGSSLTISGNVVGKGNITLNNIATAGTQTISGDIDVIGSITNTGSTRTYNLNGALGTNVTGLVQNSTGNGILALGGANAFNTETTLGVNGTILVNNSLALQNSTLNKTAGTLSFGSLVTSATLGGLTGNSGIALVNANTVTPTGLALSIGNNGSSNTFSGVLSDIGSVVKVGSGTQTLSGNNTYSGATSVSGGTLLVTGTHTTAGAYTVDNGGTLGGTGTIAASILNVTVNAGGKLAPGTSPGTLTLDLGTGSLDVSAAAAAAPSMAYEIGAPANSDKIVLSTGTLAIGSGVLEFNDFVFTVTGPLTETTYTLIDTSNVINGTLGATLTGNISPSYTGTISFGDNDHDLVMSVSAVPEPAGLALIGVGSLGLLARRRREKREACLPG